MTDNTKRLRLLAADSADLEVVASAVQDAIFQIGQTRYDAPGRSFTLRLSRYMHELEGPYRSEAGLRFDGVLNVRSQGVDTAKSDAYAVILGLKFDDTDMPAGVVNLTLAGGGVIQVYVEGLDVTLADRGESRPTKRIPRHDG